MGSLLCIIVLAFFGTTLASVPTVQIEDGIISGKHYSVASGRIINAFLGIPYALPPVGKNRFKEPQPVKRWNGIWNSSLYGSECIQYNHDGYVIKGEEDCLYLNVYTPQLPTTSQGVASCGSELMDVIVYIHGGCFMFATGNVKQPDYLLSERNAVFVTINYRLGPIGFFSTGDEVVPGNNGLKDQVAALKWIRRNIDKFCGNPNSVTISGMSAGGASVHYHYFSPLSNGLFHRGISESGSVLLPWTLPKNVPEKSRLIAKRIGCPVRSSSEMIECLQERPAKQIVARLREFMPWRYNPYSPVGPVVEGKTENAFLVEEPIDSLLKGSIKNLPWLISTTEHEGLYPVADFVAVKGALQELEERWSEIAPHLLDFNYTVPVEQHKQVSEKIRDHYMGDKPISEENLPGLISMVSDRLFTAYIEHVAKVQASVSRAPVYYYRFNYRGKYSLTNKYANDDEDYGVSHGDDTQYVVKYPPSNCNETQSDRDMIDIMVNMWISFAKTGRPEVKNVNWKPISSSGNRFEYLQIDSPNDTRFAYKTNASEMFNFWTSTLGEFRDKNIKDEL